MSTSYGRKITKNNEINEINEKFSFIRLFRKLFSVHELVVFSVSAVACSKENRGKKGSENDGQGERITDHVFIDEEVIVEEAGQERAQHEPADVDRKDQ